MRSGSTDSRFVDQPAAFEGPGQLTSPGAAALAIIRSQSHAMSFRRRSLLAMSSAMNLSALPPTAVTMYRPWHGAGRRCIHCRWVEISPARGMGCLCPKCLYGQASTERTCCSYEREPGADDDLS